MSIRLRLPQNYLLAVLHAEGFFNRNPLDNKRYEIGVWQLPPSLTQLETDEEKAPFRAIGESDRMTLVFVKPVQ